MTHYDANTYEEITEETLAERYDSFLDDNGLYDGLNVDGVDLRPSKALRETEPSAYWERINDYTNSLYDAGELITEETKDMYIQDELQDWAYDNIGMLELVTSEQEKAIYDALFQLYQRDILVYESGLVDIATGYDIVNVLRFVVDKLEEMNK